MENIDSKNMLYCFNELQPNFRNGTVKYKLVGQNFKIVPQCSAQQRLPPIMPEQNAAVVRQKILENKPCAVELWDSRGHYVYYYLAKIAPRRGTANFSGLHAGSKAWGGRALWN